MIYFQKQAIGLIVKIVLICTPTDYFNYGLISAGYTGSIA
jgi:hypothetical protein